MYEVETLIVAIIGACFGALGALYYISKALYDWYNTPKFRVFYPDGSTKLNCRIGEERRICINIENYGRRGAKVEDLFYHFPKSYKLKKMIRSDGREFEIKTTKEGAGIFEGYQYVSGSLAGIATFYFSPKEIEGVCFDVKLPEKGGLHSIFINGYPVNEKTFVLELKIASA